MTVAEFIEKLKTFPQELPVCIGDYQDQYREPWEDEAADIQVYKNREYFPKGGDRKVFGDFVGVACSY